MGEEFLIPALIGSIGGIGTSLFGGLMGQNAQKSANKANIALAHQLNASQIAYGNMWNLANMDFANKWNQNQLNYAKESRDLTFAREDNSVQRRVNDMVAAGLNPALAAGGAQSSNPIGFSSQGAGANQSYKPSDIHKMTEDQFALAVKEAFQNGQRAAQSFMDMKYMKQQMVQSSENHKVDVALKNEEIARSQQERAESIQRINNIQAQISKLVEDQKISANTAAMLKEELQYMKDWHAKIPTDVFTTESTSANIGVGLPGGKKKGGPTFGAGVTHTGPTGRRASGADYNYAGANVPVDNGHMGEKIEPPLKKRSFWEKLDDKLNKAFSKSKSDNSFSYWY